MTGLASSVGGSRVTLYGATALAGDSLSSLQSERDSTMT